MQVNLHLQVNLDYPYHQKKIWKVSNNKVIFGLQVTLELQVTQVLQLNLHLQVSLDYPNHLKMMEGIK